MTSKGLRINTNLTKDKTNNLFRKKRDRFPFFLRIFTLEKLHCILFTLSEICMLLRTK